MARPTWIAAGRFGRHNGGQLPSIVLVLESKMQLRMAGFPHNRCEVAGRLLRTDKTFEHGMLCLWIVTADRRVIRHSPDDEMGSRLSVLEHCARATNVPRHSRHRCSPTEISARSGVTSGAGGELRFSTTTPTGASRFLGW
jgi:hypothetical protein